MYTVQAALQGLKTVKIGLVQLTLQVFFFPLWFRIMFLILLNFEIKSLSKIELISYRSLRRGKLYDFIIYSSVRMAKLCKCWILKDVVDWFWADLIAIQPPIKFYPDLWSQSRLWSGIVLNWSKSTLDQLDYHIIPSVFWLTN